MIIASTDHSIDLIQMLPIDWVLNDQATKLLKR